MSVEEYLQTRDGEKPLGVYALYNAHNAVQYIGYSRNMVLAVKVLSPKLVTASIISCAMMASNHTCCAQLAYTQVAQHNVFLSVLLQNHLQRVGEARCAFVRAMVFANAAMASRTNLEREMYSWIDREGVIPSGNGPEKDLWDVSPLASNIMPAINLTVHESCCQWHAVISDCSPMLACQHAWLIIYLLCHVSTCSICLQLLSVPKRLF